MYTLLIQTVIVLVCLTTSISSMESFSNHDGLLDDESVMLRILDSMEKLMTGGDQFNRNFYFNIRQCMSSFDSRLPEAQDSAWQGVINYWKMNGTSGDPWGGNPSFYFENNVTETDVEGMTIYEPCDYASNVVYYHDVIEFCGRRSSDNPFSLADDYQKSLGKVFSMLAMGSAFWHGSHTILAQQQDKKPLAAMAYLIHQGSLSTLTSKSPILHDLNDKVRARNAIEIIDDFQDMYLSLPVEEWHKKTELFDIPEYNLIFAGLVSTVLTVAFEPETVDIILHLLFSAFKLPDDLQDFLVNKYIPEIRNATSHIQIRDFEKAHYLGNALGSFSKLIYAFLWQERELTKSKLFLDPVVNYIGWVLLPRINHIANQFISYEHYDPQLQKGVNLYPGGDWCNPVIPHAKWHLQTGIGLVDLTYLADETSKLLATY